MATFNKGILGGFSGTVGNVVGSTWKGKNVLRSLPTGGNSNPSTSQLIQRNKFAIAGRFIQSMKDLVSTTFSEFAKDMTGPNSALQYTLRNAVVGEYPNLNLNYTLVLVSRGGLPNASGVDAQSVDPGKVFFSWTDNSGLGHAKATDRSILVVYCPEFNMTVYTLNGDVRSGLESVIDVPAFRGRSVETWISFISADGKAIANSIHTGRLTVL